MNMYLLIITLFNPTNDDVRQITSEPQVFTLRDCRENAKVIGKAVLAKYPQLIISAKCIDSGVTNL